MFVRIVKRVKKESRQITALLTVKTKNPYKYLEHLLEFLEAVEPILEDENKAL